MTKKKALIEECKRAVKSRWALSEEECIAIERQDPTWAEPLALSLSIMAFLGDSAMSERQYLAAPRARFRGWSAREVMTRRDNGLRQVWQMVESETP